METEMGMAKHTEAEILKRNRISNLNRAGN